MYWFETATFVIASALTAVVTLFVLSRRTRQTQKSLTGDATNVAFLFEDGALVHATPLAYAVYDANREMIGWPDMRSVFTDRFPGIPERPTGMEQVTLDLAARDNADQGRLRIELNGKYARVELIEPHTLQPIVDADELRDLQKTQRDLLDMCNASPFPMWRTDASDQVIWSNKAYDTIARMVQNESSDTLAPIFDVPKPDEDRRRVRASLLPPGNETPTWYDVCATPMDEDTVFHATNIDAVIQAEIAQRNFVQTLAKTFAQLSTGLAIFDRGGQLVLFNPALLSLTRLPVEFLSARPDLLSFFDRLRDNRAMPEPKNYATWREGITNMIAAATDGEFQETWTLENDQTYRVSGRPHPDGALAFLIEDISNEISVKRKFRADLDLGRSLLDSLHDAVVVFSSSGRLSLSNSAYRALWKTDPEKAFADVSISDSIQMWRQGCHPSPEWDDIHDFVMRMGERTEWQCSLTSSTDQPIELTLTPLPSGDTVLRFSVSAARNVRKVPEAQA